MQVTAAYLVGRQRVELRELDLEPREDEVLIRVAACGICHGDVLNFDREHAAPRRFGHEPVGQIVARGPWVKGLAEGDWVVGCLSGSFATHVLARERDCFPVSADLTQVGAALAEPLKCVTTVCRAAAPDFRDTVVVVGCGFMGLATISLLARTWAKAVIAVDTAESRRALALELGATHAVDPAADDVRQRILDLTSGTGADVAVEFAGQPQAVTRAARSLRRRGRLVLAGGYSVGDAESARIYLDALTVHHAPPAFSPNQPDDWRRTIDTMAAGLFPLDRLLTHRFKLSALQDALETAACGASAGYLKGIVRNDLSY